MPTRKRTESLCSYYGLLCLRGEGTARIKRQGRRNWRGGAVFIGGFEIIAAPGVSVEKSRSPVQTVEGGGLRLCLSRASSRAEAQARRGILSCHPLTLCLRGRKGFRPRTERFASGHCRAGSVCGEVLTGVEVCATLSPGGAFLSTGAAGHIAWVLGEGSAAFAGSGPPNQTGDNQ